MPKYGKARASLGASLLALTLACAANGAWAQQAPAQQTPARAGAPNGANGLQEVVVTAQRRSEVLQRVPMEVQAFSAKQLQTAGVQRTEDLMRVTPGLFVAASQNQGTPFLRGVGIQSDNPGEENGVAVYVDDTYYKDSDGALTSLDNAQGVEVLKGPQGTLYGRNATGGLIHIIYPDPQDTPHGVVRLGYESYNTIIGSFYATGPITDTLDGNIAFNGHYQFDGFGTNVTLHNDVDYYRYANIRTKLLWKPTNQDRVTFAANYFRDTSVWTNTIWPGTTPLFGYKPLANQYDAQQSIPSSNLLQAYDFSVKWEHNFGNGVAFKSVSAYRDVVDRFLGDVVEADPTDAVFAGYHKNTWSYQQEFLLQGTTKHLNWTAGLFYFADGSKAPLVLDLLPTPAPYGPFAVVETENQIAKLTSYAAFGQVDWRVTDSDTLTAGLRYTLDRQASRYVLALGGGGVPPQLAAAPFIGHKSFRQPTWRVAYKHQFTDNLMFWASYSRGFRSGAFNEAIQPPVSPEILDAYEGGIKATLADGRLQVGVNPFYYNYSNLQVQSYQGPVILLSNAAKARIYGVEFDATADVPVPVGDLRININTGVMHSEFARFPNCTIDSNFTVAGGVAIPGDCTGNQLPYTPEWTLSISPNYTVSLPNGGKLDLGLNYYHNGGFVYAADNLLKQPAFDMLGAEIGYTFPNDHVRLRLYGRNLTGAIVRTSSVNVSGFGVASQGLAPPRVFGAEFDYTFH